MPSRPKVTSPSSVRLPTMPGAASAESLAVKSESPLTSVAQ